MTRRVFAYGHSEKGNFRSRNEDCFGICYREDGSFLAVVCDGVGGEKGGEIVSNVAVQLLKSRFLSATQIDTVSSAEAFFRHFIVEIHNLLQEFTSTSTELSKMASTIIAIIIHPQFQVFLNVGDCHLYGFRGQLRLLNQVHTFANALAEDGIETDLQPSQYHHMLTSVIGAEMLTEKVEIQEITEPFTRFLLCSDGVYNYLSDERLREIMGADLSVHAQADLIIEEALQADSRDNLTAIVLEVICVS